MFSKSKRKTPNVFLLWPWDVGGSGGGLGGGWLCAHAQVHTYPHKIIYTCMSPPALPVTTTKLYSLGLLPSFPAMVRLLSLGTRSQNKFFYKSFLIVMFYHFIFILATGNTAPSLALHLQLAFSQVGSLCYLTNYFSISFC